MTDLQDGGDGQRPKVSVCVVTYNQRDYIGECLESIVTQRTDFPFEVIVGDDASTDGTTDIVRDYAQRYPDLIRPVFHEKNVGPFENYRVVHRMARGEYVAHVDGDDAMLPGKLVKQTALLDENPALSAAFHQLKMVNSDGRDTGKLWPLSAPPVFDTKFLLEKHPVVGHSSLMYRNSYLHDLLNENQEFIDFMIYLRLSIRGHFGYIDDVLGIYRRGVGISSINYLWLDRVMEIFDYAEKKRLNINSINLGRSNQYFQAAHNALYLNNYDMFRKYIELSWNILNFSIVQSIFYRLRYFPKFLNFMHASYKIARDIGIISDIKRRFL